VRKLAVFTIIGCAGFWAAFFVRVRQTKDNSGSHASLLTYASDSAQLAALGIRPGAQLVAYVFGASRCGFCQKPETKRAFASLRETLRTQHVASGSYTSVSVVGIAINTDLREGLGYLESIGADVFDEISVGSGWQNEHIIELVQRRRIAEPALPLIIVVSRLMTATLAPLTLAYSGDSIVKVVHGSSRIADWVRSGANLKTVNSTALEPAGPNLSR
jgi:hypothetical protein